MNIAIAAPSPVPFQVGGAERLFWGLQAHINNYTPHNAELVKIPCLDRRFWPLIRGYKAFWELNLDHFDMVISTKYPAWAVSHPNHHLYLQHTCRGVYDLYHLKGLPLQYDIPGHCFEGLNRLLYEKPRPGLIQSMLDELLGLEFGTADSDVWSFPGPLTRAVIHWLDSACMHPMEIVSYNAISANVARRRDYFPPGSRVRVVHHPSNYSGYRSLSQEFIFTLSRLENLKRIDLLLDAFFLVDTDVRLLIAGTGGQEKRLRRKAARDPRVEFLGYVSDEQVLDYYARSIFVPFVPWDEDYGLITLEAMSSGKAVLTVSDSGGVAEMVEHGHTGLVVEPDASELARAMTRLLQDPELTRDMGRRAREKAGRVSWEKTTGVVIEGQEPVTSVKVPRRKKIVVVSTFGATPPDSGGRQRIFYLYKGLARYADVDLVCLSSHRGRVRTDKPAPFFTQTLVPKSESHRHLEKALKVKLMASVQDIAAIRGCVDTGEFVEVLEQKCAGADMVILSHPYLYHAVRRAYAGPLVYDAHNVEHDLKAQVLPDTPEKNQYLDLVRQVESYCCSEAFALFYVSGYDGLRLQELYQPDPDCMHELPNGMDFSWAGKRFLGPGKRLGLKKRLDLNESPAALFVGSYHQPNIQAVHFIVDLAHRLPEIVFLVVGSACRAIKTSEVPANVRLLDVLSREEKMVALNAADIGLNPVVQGSGSNLKTLEYIAFGLPVLSTPFGLRGHDLIPGEHVMCAEQVDFVEVLSSLVNSEFAEERQKMADKALERVRRLYHWDNIVYRMVPVLIG